MNSPQGTLNHLRREADRIPAPVQAGVWIRRNGTVYRTVAGTDEQGRPALA